MTQLYFSVALFVGMAILVASGWKRSDRLGKAIGVIVLLLQTLSVVIAVLLLVVGTP